MPSVSPDEAREIISTLYSSPMWKEKVKSMPDKQVLAIYFSSCERDAFSKRDKRRRQEKEKEKQKHKPKKEQNTFEDDYGEQLFINL